MSINFSTLQGLTIPEGVVTQIADASGRVLWSAAKPVTSLIFRPDSDVDITAWTLVPSGSTNAYSLLSEEVADDDSTYIIVSVGGNGTSQGCVIGIGCKNTPNKIPSITSGTFYVRYAGHNDVTATLRLYINDILDFSNCITSNLNIGCPSYYYTQTLEITTDGIAKINEYVASNGKFPTFLMYCKFTNGATKQKNIIITQAYLELDCGT